MQDFKPFTENRLENYNSNNKNMGNFLEKIDN